MKLAPAISPGTGSARPRGSAWATLFALVSAGCLIGQANSLHADQSVRKTTPTLDEIRIEGEIAMPQVVFITARDQFQYPDDAHRRYLRWAREIAALAPIPGLIWIVGHERPSTLFPGASSLDDPVVPLPASTPEPDRRKP